MVLGLASIVYGLTTCDLSASDLLFKTVPALSDILFKIEKCKFGVLRIASRSGNFDFQLIIKLTLRCLVVILRMKLEITLRSTKC